MATAFQAGFGRADITPKLGCRLMGYGNRTHGATGVHDRLWARALVLAQADTAWAIVACELRCVDADTTREARTAIQQRVGIPSSNVFVCSTHTHSGPHDRDADNWERPLGELLADAVEQAHRALQPARIGSGYGMLVGYSINRRWIDRPVDPGVAVLRVDGDDGRPLGVVACFGCHPVVLGYDNYLVSADWPGFGCTQVEQALGPGAVSLFLQGGGGNVNPVVAGVRAALRSGRPVVAIGGVSAYYGDAGSPEAYHVGDRRGGTFAEVEELGAAFAHEVVHVHRGIPVAAPAGAIWSAQVELDAAAGAGGAAPPVPAELMLLALGDVLLVGQPGEVFAETSVQLRTHLRTLGVRTPMVVGHANGWLSYLPEPEAFPEGGYEVGRAHGVGTDPSFQPRVRQALDAVLHAHGIAPPP
jgi:hypothetical protein